MDIYERSLRLHEEYHGKLKVDSKIPINSPADLSLVYTPGVAEACKRISRNKEDIYKYTMKRNCVAVITNGTAVLGLGNIGVAASLPVMEGKCMLFKRFADIDAFPLLVDSTDIDKFVETVKLVSTGFGGINLEDISAPSCFEIEKRLSNELDIPVFHDDQHGTAIVTLAALINALRVSNKDAKSVKVVVSGAGAAGSSIVKLLYLYGIANLTVCDSKGVVYEGRPDLFDSFYKRELARISRPSCNGDLADALIDADVFIGASAPDILTPEMIKSMNDKPIIFALANPEPEIDPVLAKNAGAFIVGTGRSDFENQINNALAFPAVFKAALALRLRRFTDDMFISAAKALAGHIANPTPEKILPGIFDDGVTDAISNAICDSIMEKAFEKVS
jgi:malate dehydrogenase (oxaloacetate-decarboxylating)